MRSPQARFTSPLRGAALTARVGVAVGVCFAVCFLTGLYSHYSQEPHQPVPVPSSPVWGYRLTQGLHVVSGTVAVPLLLVKLWSVYPLLFAPLPRPRLRPLLLTALERGSVAVLVASAVFQLATGLANSAQWYPWAFSFRSAHHALAWVAVGSVVLHVAVKLPVVRAALAGPLDEPGGPREQVGPGPLTRRGLLRGTWLAGVVAALATAGSTVPLLRHVSVLGVRSGDGPGGVPVNKSAAAARVTALATSPAYRLRVRGPGGTRTLSLADLRALPQHTETLPIACVEGWSASGDWTGVRLVDLLALVDAPDDAEVVVTSLQPRGPYRRTVLQRTFASDPRTLLALGLAGEPLGLDHGFPARIIAPNRPGVLQTKWVARLEVRA